MVRLGTRLALAVAAPEIKTIFSNSAVRVCLHNADETTAKFFSEEIGKHAVVVPGISDHYMANGFGIFPTSWNRIHSQQVVARVDTDSIKRMEKHHALVYLSPAGDPEYGEVKPLMVDLRGIEEIARMHLLHNVSARKGPDGQLLEAPQAPDFAQPMADINGVGQVAGAIMQNGMMMGQPGMQSGMQPSMQSEMQPHGQDMQAGNYGQQYAQPQVGGYSYPQDQTATGGYSQPAYVQSQSGSFVQPELVNPQYQSGGFQAQSEGSVRTCPLCSKPAGKGKFCIECGQFIGASAAGTESGVHAQLVTSAALVDPNGFQQPGYAEAPTNAPPFPGYGGRTNASQIADAQNPYGAPSQPVGANAANQRTPVTSFNLDPSKLGFSQPLAQPRNNQAQNQQPPADQPGKRNVEF